MRAKLWCRAPPFLFRGGAKSLTGLLVSSNWRRLISPGSISCRSVRIGRQEDSGRVRGRLDRGFQLAPPGAMAADSSMGFHQGIAAAASVYNHHHHHHPNNMLSFQSSTSDVTMGGSTAGMGLVSMSGGPSSTAGLYHSSPNNHSSSNSNNNGGVFGNVPVVLQSRSAPGGASRGGGGTTASKYKFVTGSPSEWSDRELNILNEGLTR
uniref:Uncharacterized protein n=1 Tax=Aegilops tauschii subsp. strangulata TaxID=200361 RepID=A0A453DEI1_AEGTS